MFIQSSTFRTTWTTKRISSVSKRVSPSSANEREKRREGARRQVTNYYFILVLHILYRDATSRERALKTSELHNRSIFATIPIQDTTRGFRSNSYSSGTGRSYSDAQERSTLFRTLSRDKPRTVVDTGLSYRALSLKFSS